MCQFALYLYKEPLSIAIKHSLEGIFSLEIGRNPKCKIHLEDNLISRIQCGIYLKEDSDNEWYLVDGSLDSGRPSRNGTFLNGIRLQKGLAYILVNQAKITFSGQNFPLLIFTEGLNTASEKEYPTLSCEREF